MLRIVWEGWRPRSEPEPFSMIYLHLVNDTLNLNSYLYRLLAVHIGHQFSIYRFHVSLNEIELHQKEIKWNRKLLPVYDGAVFIYFRTYYVLTINALNLRHKRFEPFGVQTLWIEHVLVWSVYTAELTEGLFSLPLVISFISNWIMLQICLWI